MIRDITLGQYYQGDSVIHRLDPRVKLTATMVYVFELFLVRDIVTFLYMSLILLAMILLCHVPFSFMVRGLRMVLFLMTIAGVFNLFLTPGEAIWSFGALKITGLGIKNALIMVFRMIYLIIGSSILTLTTTPNSLTEGMERLMRWLKLFNIPVHEIAMMMSIALRFIPILLEETDKIMKAQQSRGANFETGNIINRAKNLVPILVPLFVSAFRRAYELSLAMEARCYNGGEGRTKMYPLKYSGRDIISYALIIISLAAIILLKVISLENIIKNSL